MLCGKADVKWECWFEDGDSDEKVPRAKTLVWYSTIGTNYDTVSLSFMKIHSSLSSPLLSSTPPIAPLRSLLIIYYPLNTG